MRKDGTAEGLSMKPPGAQGPPGALSLLFQLEADPLALSIPWRGMLGGILAPASTRGSFCRIPQVAYGRILFLKRNVLFF